MRGMRVSFGVAAALAVALLATGCGAPPTSSSTGSGQGLVEAAVAATKSDPRPKSYALLDQPIPAFRAPLATGGSLSEADLKGKWTIVDFWGIWCPDCMRDAPYVAALHAAVQQDPDLRLVSVHVDKRTGRWADVAEYVAEKQIDYPVLLDPDNVMRTAFQVAWVPTYLVVDPQGVVRSFRTDLSVETDSDGGVKRFIQDIARLRAATPSTPPAKAG